MKKSLLIAVLAFALALPVYASEIEGTLNTGISTGVEGEADWIDFPSESMRARTLPMALD